MNYRGQQQHIATNAHPNGNKNEHLYQQQPYQMNYPPDCSTGIYQKYDPSDNTNTYQYNSYYSAQEPSYPYPNPPYTNQQQDLQYHNQCQRAHQAAEVQNSSNKEPSQATKKTSTRKTDKNKSIVYRQGGGETWIDKTLEDWDPNDFRIFCGDLGNEVSDELLSKTFCKYPSFKKAKVIRDKKTGKPKGYGFVSFSNVDDFIAAMKEMNGKYVGNRPIKLRKSTWKDRALEVKPKKGFVSSLQSKKRK